MVGIPKSVKKVFDTFPVVEYPPVPNTTLESIQTIESNKYYFSHSEPKSKDVFILGVFNVFEYKGKMIPTDPISLGYTLILAHKNGLKVPSKSYKTGHSIMRLAYNASPDKQLPILLEDDSSRTIRSNEELRKLITKGLENPKDKLVLELVDTVIFDLWLLCIHLEQVDLGEIFGLQLTDLTKYDLFHTMKTWNGFGIRYPQYEMSVYLEKIADFQLLLPLLEACNHVVQLKINAFIIHIQSFLADTQLGKIAKNMQVNI